MAKKDLTEQQAEPTTHNEVDHLMTVVVISRSERSLHRITLADAETLATNGIAPPVCGSCQHFHGSSLLQVGMCRQHRQSVNPGELSCTSHRWQAGHERLSELVEDLRRHPGRAHLLKSLEFEYPRAEPADIEYLEAAERGERGAVELVGTSTDMPPIKYVYQSPVGTIHSVEWQGGEGASQSLYRQPEYKPLVELATC